MVSKKSRPKIFSI